MAMFGGAPTLITVPFFSSNPGTQLERVFSPLTWANRSKFPNAGDVPKLF
jgi:hypothetical protein